MTELLVVISIVGILSALAIPSFQSASSTNRISTAVNSLHGALLLARTEAIKRNKNVTICRSETANYSTPTCSTTNSLATSNSGWADGWIVFTDENNNGTYQPTSTPPDILILAQGKLSKNLDDISIIPNTSRKYITFGPTGQTFGTFIQFGINRPNWDTETSHDRYICIASGGRARVSTSPCGGV